MTKITHCFHTGKSSFLDSDFLSFVFQLSLIQILDLGFFFSSPLLLLPSAFLVAGVIAAAFVAGAAAAAVDRMSCYRFNFVISLQRSFSENLDPFYER
ncbi:unnamed protein product [Lactuca virosa]|uniref:Transmembrane protein n=1 Tax=Lactuca virosa TaxID=75947 RepID=A0AAU9LU57_9ASTR|nr:unnamed protein product [Lactuca virosa]